MQHVFPGFYPIVTIVLARPFVHPSVRLSVRSSVPPVAWTAQPTRHFDR